MSWWNNATKIEDPGRLKKFVKAVQGLDWSATTSAVSLQKVFEAADELVEAEAAYYYSARKKSLGWSVFFRIAGWIFGTFGTLIPLTAATKHPFFSEWTPWGYVFLALSAAMFAANALFQGTTGHIRFVSTQLQLERLTTLTRLEWLKYSSSIPQGQLSADQRDQGHDLIAMYATELYTIIIAETGEWSALMQSQIEQYQKNLKDAQSTSKGSSNSG